MNIAIMIGRAGSKGFPGKNIKMINNKMLCEFPIIAAKKSKLVDKIYVSTDCKIISRVAKKYKCEIIKRPKKLSGDKALGDHVFEHAYFEAKKRNSKKINYVILLFANAPLVTSQMINQGIQKLNKNKKADSAVSTSVYNMWSPLRARRLDLNGFLKPFVPFKTFGNPKTLNCYRDSQGDVYFADMSLSVVRKECLEKLESGLLPQKWMGRKILPILCEGGLDIDYEWQVPQVSYLLKKWKKKQ